MRPMQRGSRDVRGTAQLRVAVAKCCPAPGPLASSASPGLHKASFAQPLILPGERCLWPQHHPVAIRLLAPLSSRDPLFPPPHLLLSPCKAKKYSWRQWNLNSPRCSRAALCLGSLTLLSTCAPAQPGCSWVPRCPAAAWK